MSTPATGLAANTTYHFRIVASNPGGTGNGGDQAFTTRLQPADGGDRHSLVDHARLGSWASVNPNGGEVQRIQA